MLNKGVAKTFAWALDGLRPDNVRIYRRAVPKARAIVAACELRAKDLQDEYHRPLCSN